MRAIEHAQATSFSTAGNALLLQNQGWARSFTVSADGGRTWKQTKADIPSRQVYFFNGSRIVGQSGGSPSVKKGAERRKPSCQSTVCHEELDGLRRSAMTD